VEREVAIRGESGRLVLRVLGPRSSGVEIRVVAEVEVADASGQAAVELELIEFLGLAVGVERLSVPRNVDDRAVEVFVESADGTFDFSIRNVDGTCWCYVSYEVADGLSFARFKFSGVRDLEAIGKSSRRIHEELKRGSDGADE